MHRGPQEYSAVRFVAYAEKSAFLVRMGGGRRYGCSDGPLKRLLFGGSEDLGYHVETAADHMKRSRGFKIRAVAVA